MDTGFGDLRFRILNQVAHQAVEHVLDGFIEFELIHHVRDSAFGVRIKSREHRHAAADCIQSQQAGFVAIVEVGGAVGDFVGQIDKLRFERRTAVEQIFGQLGELRRDCNRANV